MSDAEVQVWPPQPPAAAEAVEASTWAGHNGVHNDINQWPGVLKLTGALPRERA